MKTEEKTLKTGCLLIHGFTSFRTSLEAVIPELEKRQIPWHYPILAGHNTQPGDLRGKTWEHWQNDVRTGLEYLLQETEQVVIIALSMGSLLALELAAEYPNKVSGLVLLSPALRFKSRLARHAPVISKYLKIYPGVNLVRFSSISLALKNKGYNWFPVQTFMHYWHRAQNFDEVLKRVHQSTLIIHSKKDRIALPLGAEHVFKTIPNQEKKLVWLEKSGHEILLDMETEKVLAEIFKFKALQPQ
ncbi:MAG: alpha/beta fold hydrolase [Patescibacteria group bacterium]|jgi:carboxylesterase